VGSAQAPFPPKRRSYGIFFEAFLGVEAKLEISKSDTWTFSEKLLICITSFFDYEYC